MSKIKRLPDAELEIMNALWDADAPLTAAELETALPGPPRARTTLLTLLARLEAGELDAVFSSPPPEQLGLSSCSVGRQDLVVIVPENHPLAGRKEIDLGEILDTPLVAFSKNTGLRDVVDGLFARVGRVPVPAYETEEDEAIAGLVAGGFGAAVVPDMELLKRLPVRALSIRTPAWERKFCLVWDDRRSTPLLERFCRFAAGQGESVIRE